MLPFSCTTPMRRSGSSNSATRPLYISFAGAPAIVVSSDARCRDGAIFRSCSRLCWRFGPDSVRSVHEAAQERSLDPHEKQEAASLLLPPENEANENKRKFKGRTTAKDSFTSFSRISSPRPLYRRVKKNGEQLLLLEHIPSIRYRPPAQPQSKVARPNHVASTSYQSSH